MSRSICRFMPPKENDENVKAINFVFETEFAKLKQPFFAHVNILYLVTRGSAVLRLRDQSFPLVRGSLFLALAGNFYEIKGSDDFEYVYISFLGMSSSKRFLSLHINAEAPVCHHLDDVIDFWLDALRRLNPANANLLAESVLLYTFSYLCDGVQNAPRLRKNENSFEAMLDYVDHHYADPDISLKKVAGIFSYTPKYTSLLFKKHMKTGFNAYISALRIQYALTLISEGESSVGRLAERCGFADPMYFSSVFKKRMGISPSAFIKNQITQGETL